MYLMNDSLAFSNCQHFQNRRITIDPWVFARNEPQTRLEITKHLSDVKANYRTAIWCEREVYQMTNGVLLDFGPDIDELQTVCTGIWMHFPEFPPNTVFINR
ncbi:hypothetical protein Poly51_63750 [Rubripirellula tenax]|uniref:Uncharacterized protein n=2 Tax=Rubripirellula tenax TaxID=2528015 RepID=A0A5C6DWC3_9BACT|nr:hypothetical protein Poly51_63750 [Rubripirellula tenax]